MVDGPPASAVARMLNRAGIAAETKSVRQEGRPTGQFRPTGLRPMFSPKLEAMGYRLDRQMFMMR